MHSMQLLISAEEIKKKIAEVAAILDAHYQGEPITLVMVMKGALCLVADLMRELKTPTTLEYVKASSYGERGIHPGALTVSGLDELDLSSKHVLLIDDIFDTGQTLSQIASAIQKKGPKSFQTLVLLSKSVKRTVDFTPEYILFPVDNLFVIGYGLDFKEYYRGLTGIYVLKAD
jgi:hypoxanthine phosphoribosyltransferase